ncbi:uncharacterized protein LOC107607667 [Arachis ipaensis]|uniref:uncharacterized protein LOC107607667 n=1 Tax=Arachis ipaensis TaxID=130454 RepID=UPI0007AF2707|nr:uncharacterized protein LOC107607667 [Arachis ipaensis]
MKIFVQSADYNIWKIIMNGPQVSTKTGADGVVISKIEGKWNDEDTKKIELNAKAVNMLNCAINFKKYRKVSRCKTAKEIWDKLQVTHEGTIQVKQTRIDMLCKEYEMFSMKKGESIDDMFERFSIIINGLNAMEITHSEPVLVRKVLRSLTKEWETKAIVIAENGHYNFDYPKLKKEDKIHKDKKNGLMVSWKDLKNDSDEDEDSENSS